MRFYKPTIGSTLLALLILSPAYVSGGGTRQAPRRDGADPPSVKRAGGTRSLGQEALPDPLTVEDAVRIGLERNPQIASGQAGVASAEAGFRSIASMPPVQLGVSHVGGTSSAPSLTGETRDTFVDLNKIIDTSGQRRLQAAGAKAQWQVSRYQLEETKLSLSQQIRDAYWTLVAARAQEQISLQNLQEVQRINQLIRTQEEAGAAPHVDVLRSSIEAANAQQSSISAQGAARAALFALNLLLAQSPNEPIQPADSLAETSSAPALLADLPDASELTRIALSNRPLVKQAQEQVRVSELAWEQGKASRLPDLAVDYERSLRQPIDSVVIGLQMPLFDLGSIRYSIRAAEGARKQAMADRQQAEQQVTQQATQAHLDFTQAQTLVASYQTDILAASASLVEKAQLGYQQGATGILAVIDAETTLRNARAGYIDNLLALYKARDAILAATGGLPVGVAVPALK